MPSVCDCRLALLVELWSSYNRHLANVISRMSDSVLGAECRIDGKEAVTLKWLVEDYVRHMDHHLWPNSVRRLPRRSTK